MSLSPLFPLFNQHNINSPPRVLATLLSPSQGLCQCLAPVSVFPSFRPIPSQPFLPTESNAGEMFITFPPREKNVTRLVPATTFYATDRVRGRDKLSVVSWNWILNLLRVAQRQDSPQWEHAGPLSSVEMFSLYVSCCLRAEGVKSLSHLTVSYS